MQSKPFLKIWLLSLNFENFTSINLWTDQSQSSVWSERLKCCDWSVHKFIEMNLSKLKYINQMFRIDFVSIHFHLGEISCKIIECKFFWSIWALYNWLLYQGTAIFALLGSIFLLRSYGIKLNATIIIIIIIIIRISVKVMKHLQFCGSVQSMPRVRRVKKSLHCTLHMQQWLHRKLHMQQLLHRLVHMQQLLHRLVHMQQWLHHYSCTCRETAPHAAPHAAHVADTAPHVAHAAETAPHAAHAAETTPHAAHAAMNATRADLEYRLPLFTLSSIMRCIFQLPAIEGYCARRPTIEWYCARRPTIEWYCARRPTIEWYCAQRPTIE